MFVREDVRERGIGSALLAAIIVLTEERGYARLVLSPSESSLRFSRRAGFIVPDDNARGDRLLVGPGNRHSSHEVPSSLVSQADREPRRLL
jgi:GNAT superfamily N-acetyltransferase